MTPTNPEPLSQDALAYAQAHAATIQRWISARLGSRLRRVVDSDDIQQSLLRTLCEHPQPALSENELRRLIATIVVRKICTRARREERYVPLQPSAEDGDSAAATRNPGDEAADLELLQIAQQAADADWTLVINRLEGRKFVDLAEELAVTDTSLRMRFHRALERIGTALGVTGDE